MTPSRPSISTRSDDVPNQGARQGALVSLAQLPAGRMATVCEAAATLDKHDAAMLRAMGLRPNATVRVCRPGEPCIVEVLSGGERCRDACRIGMARELADQIVVRVHDDATPATTSENP